MKKALLSLIVLLVVGVSSKAQNPKDLKGPKAKNYKVWKNDKSAEPVIAFTKKERLKGPQAKNQKPQQKNKKRSGFIVLVRDKDRSQLKGPAAKNYKSWK